MAGKFETPITIREVIKRIDERYLLLPAIQRKFVWSSEQIEMLFDSILRNYPISSLMFWKIMKPEIKSGYKFYDFLKDYREFFNDSSDEFTTTGYKDFEAVIDGQQRLTALYIGLKGSYAYKMPRKWWRDNQDCIPTRKLYLNLKEPIKEEFDHQKKFDFVFLKSDEVTDSYFMAEKILALDNSGKIMNYIINNNLNGNSYALETLSAFYEAVHVKPLINYYLEDSQDSDSVLEIFVRTNSGGTPLSFSDLLMSMTSANWEKINAREEFNKLIDDVYKLGFIINKDFILKTCLVLLNDNIKSQIKNFTHDNIQKFENNWDKIKNSINSAFKLFKKLGFNDKIFRAKNAAIPIIYYIYQNDLAGIIEKASYDRKEINNIFKWIILTFLREIFGAHSDSVLISIRQVLKANANNKNFPFQEITDAFKSNPNKNYIFDDDFINGLLEAQKDTNEAFYVLNLLYPNLDYEHYEFHQDHLHPSSIFTNSQKLNKNIPAQDINFAEDPINWNSVANLQMLNSLLNTSRKAAPLEEWHAEHPEINLYVDSDTSLNIKDFKKFIEVRRKNIREYLKKILM